MTRGRRLVAVFTCILLAGLVGLALVAQLPRPSLPALTPAQATLERTLHADIITLAQTIGERNDIRREALKTAADWLARDFARDGYRVERQPFKTPHSTDENVIASLRGPTGQAHEVVVIGAHYDTVMGSPGANDNGSGIAALRAIARAFRGRRTLRELRFVAFANEEYGFQTEQMGSLVYAKRCRANGDQVTAMLSLETMGYYSQTFGSQHYPMPALAWFYPNRGDFLGVVGNTASLPLARFVATRLRTHTPFPIQWAALPEAVPGAAWSDHWAFWREGYPAILITDTAPFRYAYYHTSQDTPDKLDYSSLTRVVEALMPVVSELAGTP
jgi:hypothetical protein